MRPSPHSPSLSLRVDSCTARVTDKRRLPAYTYTPSGASPAQLASPCFGPLGKAPTVTARGTLGSWGKATHTRLSLRGKARLFPRAASTTRVTMLRRRNTASSPRSRLVSHRANQSLAVPLRSFLACVALPRPSIRRVFLRSLCARRCPIDSLSLIRDKIAVWLISAWQFRYNMTQSRCKQGKRRKTTKWAIKTATQKGGLPIWPMRMPLMA